MKKVVIQGQAGSYHHIAADNFFDDVEISPANDFAAVFQAIVSDQTKLGLCAIENSLYGSINQVYDLLLKHRLHIVGEIYLRIHHCLIGFKDAELETVRKVYSQREALAQCQDFLSTQLDNAQEIETDDTAGAVETIKKQGNNTSVAIASESAATIHDMFVLKRGIESNKQNYTRFIVLSSAENYCDEKADKTSIVLEMPERAGILHKVLGVFAERHINLSKIESRPLVGKAWQYLFYLDFERSINDEHSQSALSELQALECKTTLLGSYQKGRLIA